MTAQAAPGAANPADSSQSSEDRKLATELKLTPNAYKVVVPPWINNAPVAELKKLSVEDIDSIRNMLRDQPNQFWPQALSSLALVGNAKDTEIIEKAVRLPMPALIPSQHLSEEDANKLDDLQRIKLTAPTALGLLAKRTKSENAVKTLIELSNVDQSAKIIGTTNASDLSKAAIVGLTDANTPAANAFVKNVIETQSSPVVTQPNQSDKQFSNQVRETKWGIKIPAFSPKEIIDLQASIDK